MLRRAREVSRSEAYVATPPALWVIDENQDVFTLGESYRSIQGGEYAFEVLVNGKGTGLWACRIERKGGRIRAFCGNKDGYRSWNGRSFV